MELETLNKTFNDEILRSNIFDINQLNKNYEEIRSHIIKLPFTKFAIDIFDDDQIKFTLCFEDCDKMLMITKSDKPELIVTYFFERKLLYAGYIIDLSDFVEKFKQYLKNKN
jgi:hypothetical protein